MLVLMAVHPDPKRAACHHRGVARLDNQIEFQSAAAEDGIELAGQSVKWLCYRGHWALLESAAETRDDLERIWQVLKGDPGGYAARPATQLTGDFIHEPTGTLIEYDETQHFSTARLKTLPSIPPPYRWGSTALST